MLVAGEDGVVGDVDRAAGAEDQPGVEPVGEPATGERGSGGGGVVGGVEQDRQAGGGGEAAVAGLKQVGDATAALAAPAVVVRLRLGQPAPLGLRSPSDTSLTE